MEVIRNDYDGASVFRSGTMYVSDEGLVVLCTKNPPHAATGIDATFKGVVLTPDKTFDAGYYGEHWLQHKFAPYHGEITLKQN